MNDKFKYKICKIINVFVKEKNGNIEQDLSIIISKHRTLAAAENSFRKLPSYPLSGIFDIDAEMQAEQIGWHHKVPNKNMDFTKYKLWLTTDNGNEPIGIDTVEDLLVELNY